MLIETNEMTPDVFETRIIKYRSSLIKYARSLTKNGEDADDLYQDTLIRAFRYRHRFSFDYSFSGWIKRIMTNLFINNYYRKKLPIQENDLFGDEYLPNRTSRLQSRNSGYDNLVAESIYEEIDKLENKHRESFLLYFRGHKYQEIAERLNIPLGTVKNRIHVARQVLQSRVCVN